MMAANLSLLFLSMLSKMPARKGEGMLLISSQMLCLLFVTIVLLQRYDMCGISEKLLSEQRASNICETILSPSPKTVKSIKGFSSSQSEVSEI